MASDMEVHTKQRCVTEFLHAEIMAPYWHSSTLEERLWRSNSRCEHREGLSGAFQQTNSNMKNKPRSRQPCPANTLQNDEQLNQLIHAIDRLWPGNWVWSWILASTCWKQWWKRWNTSKFAPPRCQECSHKDRRNNTSKFVRMCWRNMKLKMPVSWNASLLATKCGVITTSQSQNNSPGTVGNMDTCGDIWIP